MPRSEGTHCYFAVLSLGMAYVICNDILKPRYSEGSCSKFLSKTENPWSRSHHECGLAARGAEGCWALGLWALTL